MRTRIARIGTSFWIGLLVGLVPLGCGSIPFPYHFYGLEASSYEGHLLGVEPKDDLALKECAPDEKEKGKCVVLLRQEFFNLKQDYLQTKSDLIECQKAHQMNP